MNNQDTNDAAGPIQVEIFNRTYSLRSGSGDERVRQVARLVDERMREVSSRITTHDVSKIAVLAALNIADELQGLKEYYAQEAQPPVARPSEVSRGDGPAGEPGAANGQEGAERQSWFEAIFDAEETPRNRGERLSSQISAKLQSLRPSGRAKPAAEADERE